MQVFFIQFGNFPFQTTPIPYEYAKNLTQQGVHCHVLALSSNREDELDENLEGIQITRIPTNGNPRSFKTLETLAQSANAILNSHNFDIVHVFAFRGAGYLRVRARGLGNKWLIHLISGNISGGMRSNLSNRLTKFECRFFDKIIVNTNNVGKWVLGDLHAIDIPPGVDFDRFLPGINQEFRRQLGYNSDDIVLIYLGSMSERRKLATLLQGFSEAHNKISRLKLLMVGPGDRSKLELVSRSLGIEAHVKFLPPVPYLYMHKYISVADIGFAYVPITPEFNPQPALKTLELLSSGKPIIATETDGNAYFINNEVNGILVKDSSEGITDGLIRLIDNDTLRKSIRERARKSVNKYDWKRIVSDSLIPVYSQVLLK